MQVIFLLGKIWLLDPYGKEELIFSWFSMPLSSALNGLNLDETTLFDLF